ncbi:cytochrome c oxidase assembly protein [Kiloniella laminariae]|uniref:Cytochrome c oxidase assembly protein CtaG n=1 Tax=Kiloniella laminariae TaxID=454162 RepID=A0ABT4LL25_9PROT|nr:cytochrome c oxidase assembly protein [Kiloniella laminariae]MCZ4281781.1 cytochrome c oxidase assembly protein [Kiloniella laminariae]
MTATVAKNTRVALVLGGVVCGMIALAFASVPLYRLFCQVTGFGGTTQVAEAGAENNLVLGSREMTIRFDSSVNGDLPWTFKPAQRAVSLTAGESGIAFYQAKNTSDEAVRGVATFNVTPLKAGQYFVKIDCFCFSEQTLLPGQEVDMPVTFYVDPEIENDPNLSEVKTITLSYTFFRDDEAVSQEVSGLGNNAGQKPAIEIN